MSFGRSGEGELCPAAGGSDGSRMPRGVNLGRPSYPCADSGLSRAHDQERRSCDAVQDGMKGSSAKSWDAAQSASCLSAIAGKMESVGRDWISAREQAAPEHAVVVAAARLAVVE